MKKDTTAKAGSPELPYERFLRFGPECLTEAELLAIILRTGTADNHVMQAAEQVLKLARYPREGLLGLYNVTLEELLSVRGIGQVKAVRLKCLAELSKRMSEARAREGLDFKSPVQVADYFMEKLRHKDTGRKADVPGQRKDGADPAQGDFPARPGMQGGKHSSGAQPPQRGSGPQQSR